jgi:charged multivesicular body protein 7
LSEDRSLIPLSPFLSSARSVYAADPLLGRVASTLVGRPLWWALQQAGVVSTDDSETDARRWRRLAGDYVVLGLVENAAERVLDHQATLDHGSASDGLYSWADFRKTFAGVAVDGTTLSEEDVKVVVKFLQRDKGVVVADKTVSAHLSRTFVPSSGSAGDQVCDLSGRRA